MLKSLLITAMAALLTVSLSFAEQSEPNKIVIPVNKTVPTNGKQMYMNYCAPCHAVDGKGQGPAASAMTTRPTDLTVLAKNHNGKYPDAHIVTVLRFGSELPAHGSAQMPVWGPILGNMNRSNDMDKELRINNLSRYLETIQQR